MDSNRVKRISVRQARLGMFVDGIDGNWFGHPFWRTRFPIDHPDQLARLMESGVQTVRIDILRGVDVLPRSEGIAPVSASAADGGCAGRDASSDHCSQPAHAHGAQQSPPESPSAPQRQLLAVTDRVSMSEELETASRLIEHSRGAIKGLFDDARMGRAVDLELGAALVEGIAESVMRNSGALISLARLKTADDYTYLHSIAVCALMVALGRQMGMEADRSRSLGMAGLMHDLGKALVPLQILNKPGKLTDEEFALVRLHPEFGFDMLRAAGTSDPVALDVCLHHHEKIDGSGYPHRQAGDAIALEARLGAVCDVYDAITSDRPYKAGWDPADALSKMANWEGHFDPDVFNAFVKSLGIYPTGSLVRMESERLAIVLEQNPQALTAPVVRVFFSARTGMPIATRRIDLASSRSGDRIVQREPRERWNFPHLETLWADQAARRRTKP